MAENNPAISVIIAMYNAEKYIAECLESLLNQTFQDFEVVVVDDCSTDNSVEIIESFAPKFATSGKVFYVVNIPENSGTPGLPRNIGIQMARGKYVYFLDSDDLLTEKALEEFYNVAEKFNAEVVHVEKYFLFPDGSDKNESKIKGFQQENFVSEPMLDTFDIGERVAGFIQRKYLWWACNKLFLRKFLVDNGIKFTSTNVFEDMIFAFMCVVTAKVYVRVPFVSYYYRIRKASMSHKLRDAVDSSMTMFKVVNILDKFMSDKKFFRDNPQYRYAMLDFFIQMRLEVIAKKFFKANAYDPAGLFVSFRDKIFAANPNYYTTLTAYLFIASSILKLQNTQQAAEIDSLKKVILEVTTKKAQT